MKAYSAPRWAAFVIWALAAGSATHWALRWLAPSPEVPPRATVVGSETVLRGDPLRVLGRAPAAVAAAPVPVAAASRFQLIGVVAPRPAQAAAEGVALIAVDGRPPRAYRVGAAIDGDAWVLQRVRAKGADLGPRGADAPSVALDLAPLPPPATGSLPPAVSGGGAPVSPPPAPVAAPVAPPPAAPFAGAPPVFVPSTPVQPGSPPPGPLTPTVPNPVVGEPDDAPPGRSERPRTPGLPTQ